jgi:hypothetical protein
VSRSKKDTERYTMNEIRKADVKCNETYWAAIRVNDEGDFWIDTHTFSGNEDVARSKAMAREALCPDYFNSHAPAVRFSQVKIQEL